MEPLPTRDDRPTKRRRFPGRADSNGPPTVNPVEVSPNLANPFDRDLLRSLCGQNLSDHDVADLETASGRSIERAVNLFFDGALDRRKAPAPDPASTRRPVRYFGRGGLSSEKSPRPPTRKTAKTSNGNTALGTEDTPPESTPSRRFVGAFGAAGWAVCSGPAIAPGTTVLIERDRQSQISGKPAKGRPRTVTGKNVDFIVRFTSSTGREIGRLESDTAQWIAPLIDQRICQFEGSCVYSPPRLTAGETVYLQLKCFFLSTAFLPNPIPETEVPHLFESKESTAETELRLRQLSLVRLLDDINAFPTRLTSEMAGERDRRRAFLQAVSSVEPAPPENSTESSTGDAEPDDRTEDQSEDRQLDDGQLDVLYKRAQAFDFESPEMDPPPTFALSLRKYQKQALHWLVGRERETNDRNGTGPDKPDRQIHPLWDEYAWPTRDPVDDVELPADPNKHFYVNPYSGQISVDFPHRQHTCRGGILADEMGLGKTIEMLALVHANRPERPPESRAKPSTMGALESGLSAGVKSQTTPAPRTTLIVAPMSLLAQWQSEAEKASIPGSLRIRLYYGSEKAVNIRTLCSPANWNQAPDVLITTYGVVQAEFASMTATSLPSDSGIFSVQFHRVILDEAHYIKNRTSKTAKACTTIDAVHRWALTGTPIVNRLEDLFSLVRFLHVEPWSNFSFWKTFVTLPFESNRVAGALDVVQSVMEPLLLRRTKDMKTPDGQPLVPLPSRTIRVHHIELSKAEQDVYDLIHARLKLVVSDTTDASTLLRSYSAIFSHVLRLRQVCCHPILTRRAVDGDAGDDAEVAKSDEAVMGDDVDLNSLIDRFTAEAEAEDTDVSRFGAHALRQIQDAARLECPICTDDPMVDQTVGKCWHGACRKCLLTYIDFQMKKETVPVCMTCRQPMLISDLYQVIRHDDDDGYNDCGDGGGGEGGTVAGPDPGRISLRRITSMSSAKVTALLEQLHQLRRAHNRAVASGFPSSIGSKVIVFSQFTSFLDLIQSALTRDHIASLRFDGTMTQSSRAGVLTDFRNRDESKPNSLVVLLVSLRAGGVGLNLTCARHVFMMDPWWSFAVEAQAIDRVHRMGQEHEVTVTRFIVRGSIEEKMLRIQEKKKFLATSLGMMNDEEKRLRRVEDIKDLLS